VNAWSTKAVISTLKKSCIDFPIAALYYVSKFSSQLEEPLNKTVGFLFITCALCFTIRLKADQNPGDKPTLSFGLSQSQNIAEDGIDSTQSLLAAASSPSLGGDAQSQNIGEDEVEPKKPILATFFAVLPGLFIHGFGNFYAQDFDDGTKMLTMEVIGGGICLFGYNVIHYPDNWGPYFGDSTPQAGYWIEAGGWTLITASFIWDLVTAGQEAESYNEDHDINFHIETRENGTNVFAYTHKF
jgi:hypothetical protein